MRKESILHNIFTLGAASILDYAIQLILPIILVRLLDEESFAHYRMLFLLVNAVMAFAPLYMPQALFYFLPQARSQRERMSYIANTALFMMLTGLLGAAIINPWLQLVPNRFFLISQDKYLIPLFIYVWVLGSLIDSLPNAFNQVKLQARIMIFLSTMRVTSVTAIALITKNVEYVFFALCIFSALKCFILLFYIKTKSKNGQLVLDCPLLTKQIKYALPFGISGALYMLKNQSDQWIVATLFSPVEYAIFSFGIYVAPLMNMLRNAINNGALPIMSEDFSAGNITAVLNHYRRANFIMACLLLPVLTVLFISADAIIRFMFTDAYAGAANVMRVYIIGFVAQCLESTTILRLCNAGNFALKINLMLLPLAILMSYIGALYYGLPGAAIGSVVTLYIGEVIYLKKSAAAMQSSLLKVIDWKSWLWVLISTVVAGSCAYYIGKNFNLRYLDSIFLTTLVTISISLILFYFLYYFKLIDRNLFRNL